MSISLYRKSQNLVNGSFHFLLVFVQVAHLLSVSNHQLLLLHLVKLIAITTMNVFTKFHHSPCGDVSQDKWKLWPAGGARWQFRGFPKSAGFILCGAGASVYSLTANHLCYTSYCLDFSLESGGATHTSTLRVSLFTELKTAAAVYRLSLHLSVLWHFVDTQELKTCLRGNWRQSTAPVFPSCPHSRPCIVYLQYIHCPLQYITVNTMKKRRTTPPPTTTITHHPSSTTAHTH